MRVCLAAMMCSPAQAGVVAATVVFACCVPSSAVAVEVAIGQPPNANTIFVTAVAGEDNALMITQDAGGYTVDENGPAQMTPGAGCAAGYSPNTATCPAAGIAQLYITLRDGDDGVTVATATNAVILGGSGNDTLTGGRGSDRVDGQEGEDYLDGGPSVDRLDAGSGADVVVARDRARDEPVSCGPGEDLAIIDQRDRSVRYGSDRCEQVDEGRQTTPRPGWVYVHPRRCAASAKGVELGLAAMHRLVPLRHSILLASGFRSRPPPTLDATGCPARVRATVGRGAIAFADVSGGAVTVGRPACGAGGRADAVPHEPRVRVNTHRRRGDWRVKGEFSIAAAFGTDWTTLEGCSRTVTVVRAGRVHVYDRAKRRTVTVRAGHRYVARRGRTSR
jgi:Ca2+-binding RTX toxin-like protein